MTYADLLKMGKALVGNDRGFDIELLLAHLSQWSRGLLLAHLDDEAEEAVQNQFQKHLEEMANGRPLQYILGEAYFNGNPFSVREGVLIPRFDTEILLQVVEKEMRQRQESLDVLELCVGSGALSISLALDEPKHRYFASDIADIPLAVATENSERYQVSLALKKGDLFEPWHDLRFAIILANPPYIDDEEMKKLDKTVLQEPHLALYGGEDGLDFYRKIIAEAQNHLEENGFLAVEIGYNQGPEVAALFRKYGYDDVHVTQDFQGHDRVVSGRLE